MANVSCWAVGMTTAPRHEMTLSTSLRSLGGAGWDRPRLFVEPNTVIPSEFAQLPTTHRDATLGAFPNWYLGLAELVMRQPRSDAYMMCQDDVIFSQELRGYLEQALWPAAQVGVVSLYCPGHEHQDGSCQFDEIDPGWNAWGALAYVFSNPGVRQFLSDPIVVNHRHHGPRGGERNVDSVVGNWCRRRGLAYFVHRPSLAQHIGRTSTIWKNSSASGRRRAKVFSEDVSELLKKPCNAPNDSEVDEVLRPKIPIGQQSKRLSRPELAPSQRPLSIREHDPATGRMTIRPVRSITDPRGGRECKDTPAPGVKGHIENKHILKSDISRQPNLTESIASQIMVSVFEGDANIPTVLDNFAGDYILSRVNQDPKFASWEYSFPISDGFYRLIATARFSRSDRAHLRVKFEGTKLGPVWSGTANFSVQKKATLQRVATTIRSIWADSEWPDTVDVSLMDTNEDVTYVA